MLESSIGNDKMDKPTKIGNLVSGWEVKEGGRIFGRKGAQE